MTPQMEAGLEPWFRRVTIALGWSCLLLLCSTLARGLWVPVRTYGFPREIPSLLQCLLLRGLEPRTERGLVLLAAVALFALSLVVVCRDTTHASRWLGAVGSSVTAIHFFVVRLLPARIRDAVVLLLVPDDPAYLVHADLVGEPIEASFSWWLPVLMSTGCWIIGHRCASEGPAGRRAARLTGPAFILTVLVVTVLGQSGGLHLPDGVLNGALAWSLWTGLSGVFVGWGQKRANRGTEAQ